MLESAKELFPYETSEDYTKLIELLKKGYQIPVKMTYKEEINGKKYHIRNSLGIAKASFLQNGSLYAMRVFEGTALIFQVEDWETDYYPEGKTFDELFIWRCQKYELGFIEPKPEYLKSIEQKRLEKEISDSVEIPFVFFYDEKLVFQTMAKNPNHAFEIAYETHGPQVEDWYYRMKKDSE